MSFLKVRAKNDAHIGLFTHKKSAADMYLSELFLQSIVLRYEIVIGGWKDMNSAIRQCSHCRNAAG